MSAHVLAERQSADVVVMLAAADVPLAQAIRCLKPGGALYWEIDRRSRAKLGLSPRRAGSLLHGAGLTVQGVYWANPGLAWRRMYVPLDIDEALQWYFATSFVARSPRHRLVETILRVSTGFKGRRFATVAPAYAVTAQAPPLTTAPPSVLARLPPSVVKLPRNVRPFVVTSGSGEWSRVTLLPFASGVDHPNVVCKLPRLARFNADIEREQATLREIHAVLDTRLRQTLPQPLGTFTWGDLTVGLETYAAGNSLSISSGRWGATWRQRTEDLRLAAAWLTEFHRQTIRERLPVGDARLDLLLDKPLIGYEQAFGATPAEARLFGDMRARRQALKGALVPLVWQHTDFGTWNIRRDGRDLRVIDWEISRRGPALCDLLYFVTHWSHLVQGLANEQTQLRDVADLFFGSPRSASRTAIVHQTIERYMADLGLDRRLLPLLHVYTYAEQALERVARLRALADADPTCRAGNQFVAYLGVLADRIRPGFGY